METYLWKIHKEKLNKTNLALYSDFISENFKIKHDKDFNKIWQWSVDNPKIFWKSIWDFTKVKGSLGNILLQESNIFFKNKFFPDSYLNYAENLLKKNNNELSIIFKSENGYKNNLSWKDLNLNVVGLYRNEIQKNIVSSDELQKVKKRLVNETIFAQDSLYMGMRIFGSSLSTGYSLKDITNWSDDIQKVSINDLQNILLKTFDINKSVTGYLLSLIHI